MTLGDKLKSLRVARSWTQPEAADAIGVEQSYLSKLENNHSVPSADVLRRIAGAYETTLAEIVDSLDDHNAEVLRQIPDVVDLIAQRKDETRLRRKRLVSTYVIAVALGASFIYAGMSHLFFLDTVYWYKSHGVIRDGESKDLFSPLTSADIGQRQVPSEFEPRLDAAFSTVNTYRGESYNVPVTSGSRTYYLEKTTQIDPWQNKAITFLGIFAAVYGVFGLLVLSAGPRKS